MTAGLVSGALATASAGAMRIGSATRKQLNKKGSLLMTGCLFACKRKRRRQWLFLLNSSEMHHRPAAPTRV